MDTGKSLHVEVFYIFIYGHKNLAQESGYGFSEKPGRILIRPDSVIPDLTTPVFLGLASIQ
jgi:hypothetical protein